MGASLIKSLPDRNVHMRRMHNLVTGGATTTQCCDAYTKLLEVYKNIFSNEDYTTFANLVVEVEESLYAMGDQKKLSESFLHKVIESIPNTSVSNLVIYAYLKKDTKRIYWRPLKKPKPYMTFNSLHIQQSLMRKYKAAIMKALPDKAYQRRVVPIRYVTSTGARHVNLLVLSRSAYGVIEPSDTTKYGDIYERLNLLDLEIVHSQPKYCNIGKHGGLCRYVAPLQLLYGSDITHEKVKHSIMLNLLYLINLKCECKYTINSNRKRRRLERQQGGTTIDE